MHAMKIKKRVYNFPHIGKESNKKTSQISILSANVIDINRALELRHILRRKNIIQCFADITCLGTVHKVFF